jgi:hypothetical protein
MSDRRNRDVPALSDRGRVASDRRTAMRYATKGTLAVIGWSVGAEYQTIAATLIDISLGGFMASVETFPPLGEAVWLRLDGENPSPWIKASVVGTDKTGLFRWTRRRVRLRFLEDCPYEFFKAAIEGFTREYECPDGTIEGFDGRHWH